jgi:hypothetical protein
VLCPDSGILIQLNRNELPNHQKTQGTLNASVKRLHICMIPANDILEKIKLGK